MNPPREPRPDIEPPPTTFLGTLARLGPGMIIAGSIVGSGELIATTTVGAKAGFYLLWLIIAGCTIKVFAQVEIGRFTVTHGRSCLDGLNDLPGPRLRVNWVVIGWAIMTCLILSQQGGIVGGVGQAMAISAPITAHGRDYNVRADELIRLQVAAKSPVLAEELGAAGSPARIAALDAQLKAMGPPHDDVIWAVAISIVTAVMLYFGRYRFIEIVSTVLVAGFTAVTLFTLVALQFQERWAVTGSELASGLSFGLPPGDALASVSIAMATLGIIGVGTSELIMYPYWCQDKGYARSTGPDDGTAAWVERARGWMRVMRIDALCSMVVYTLATVGFYLLGAAVLGRVGLNPGGGEMVRTLAEMYVPVFGEWAHGVFLLGAFAVLYSTFFVASAGNARIIADGLGLMGVIGRDEATRKRWVRLISAGWPLVAVMLYAWFRAPVAMVLASGMSQAILLPVMGAAALFFRYKRGHPGLRPGLAWDVMLWVSSAGMLLVGLWAVGNEIAQRL